MPRPNTAERQTFNLQPSTHAFAYPVTRHSSLVTRSAFSLVEVLVVVSLLSLIVFALMAVFNSTQSAFRASVSQTDVLEGGRAAVDLITADLRQLTPSGSYSNLNSGPINFFVADNNNYPVQLGYSPLIQPLTGGSVSRTNYLNYFFILGHENTKWIGIGYAVDATNTAPLYPLYRFYQETNISTSPLVLYQNFVTAVYDGQWTNLSHVIDGVVNLAVIPSDANGYPISYTTNFDSNQEVTNDNIVFFTLANGTRELTFFSNTVPAFVELQLGVLEDRPLQRAESLPFQSIAQSNYLAQQAGRVHIFRQRVTIPNVDPSAYQ